MGKGGGCVPSKKKLPKPTTAVASDYDSLPESTPPPATNHIFSNESMTSTISDPTRNPKLFIVFYSMYGHVEGLARRMKRGVEMTPGVDAVLYRVPETRPEDVLREMQAPRKDDSIPVIGSPDELTAADGFLFGFPTRYGCMAAQMKAFFLFYGTVVERAEARWQACWLLRQHRNSRWRPRDYCVDSNYTISSSQDAVHSNRIHFRRLYVQNGFHQRRYSIWCWCLCR